MALMNQEEIKAIIPHRHPFLLIDEIESMTTTDVVAIKYVRADEYYFQGHFPEEPVMPGVLIVESIAQSGAVCVLSQPAYRGKIAYFAKLDNVRFRHKVVPGDILRLEMTLDVLRGPIGKGKGKAFVGDTLCCEAALTFSVGS